MKIAIFGGSFNPVTKGHTRLANYIVENGVADQVLMMPCYKSLYNKGLASGDQRLDMIALSHHHPRVKPYDWEIKNKVDGPGTYQIMQMVGEEFPLAELFFVIGLDNSQKVRTWKNGDKIVENMQFIVVPRGGVVVTDRWYMNAPHIFIDKYQPDDISSTCVKQLIKEGKGTENVLDQHVKEYIVVYNLYRD